MGDGNVCWWGANLGGIGIVVCITKQIAPSLFNDFHFVAEATIQATCGSSCSTENIPLICTTVHRKPRVF